VITKKPEKVEHTTPPGSTKELKEEVEELFPVEETEKKPEAMEPEPAPMTEAEISLSRSLGLDKNIKSLLNPLRIDNELMYGLINKNVRINEEAIKGVCFVEFQEMINRIRSR